MGIAHAKHKEAEILIGFILIDQQHIAFLARLKYLSLRGYRGITNILLYDMYVGTP